MGCVSWVSWEQEQKGAADKWLTSGVNIRAMERVAGNNIHIRREVLLEGSDFRSLARSLATDNGALLSSFEELVLKDWNLLAVRTWPILFNDFINRGGLYIVDDVVTCSGDEMTIGIDFDLFLWTSQHLLRRMLCTARYLLGLQIPHEDPHISPPCRRH